MANKNPRSNKSNIFLRLTPLQRVLLSLIVAGIAFFFLPKNEDPLIETMIVWIVFAAVYLITGWVILYTRPIHEIKKTARGDDGSKVYVFIMVILSALASIIIVFLLMISKAGDDSDHSMFIFVSVTGILIAWFMVHTLYTFHYAHMYYNNAPDDNSKNAEGLEFPGDEEPDYIDFAYFSFTIGCTFQVSDIEISSRAIRHSVLWHGLLSFALNTFVVAFSINLVAGLMK